MTLGEGSKETRTAITHHAPNPSYLENLEHCLKAFAVH